MDTPEKSRLAELVEQLPEQEINAAVRYLEFLKSRSDPYLKYLMSVPEEEEELTEEFKRKLNEAREDVGAGRLISSDRLKQELGL